MFDLVGGSAAEVDCGLGLGLESNGVVIGGDLARKRNQPAGFNRSAQDRFCSDPFDVEGGTDASLLRVLKAVRFD